MIDNKDKEKLGNEIESDGLDLVKIKAIGKINEYQSFQMLFVKTNSGYAFWKDFYEANFKVEINELKKLKTKENMSKYIDHAKRLIKLQNQMLGIIDYILSLTIDGRIKFNNSYNILTQLSVVEPQVDFEVVDGRLFYPDNLTVENRALWENLYEINYSERKIKIYNVVNLDYLIDFSVVKSLVLFYSTYDVLYASLKTKYEEYETMRSDEILCNIKEMKTKEITKEEIEKLEEIINEMDGEK